MFLYPMCRVPGRRQFLSNVKLASAQGGTGRRHMPVLLGDVLLFFCLAAWVAGMVIAIASLLS
jgi:hypothetical protein